MPEAEPRRDAVGLHIGQLVAYKENALLVGRRQRQRERRAAGAIEEAGSSALHAAGRSDVLGPPGETDILVELIARQNRAAVGGSPVSDPELRALRHVG